MAHASSQCLLHAYGIGTWCMYNKERMDRSFSTSNKLIFCQSVRRHGKSHRRRARPWRVVSSCLSKRDHRLIHGGVTGRTARPAGTACRGHWAGVTSPCIIKTLARCWVCPFASSGAHVYMYTFYMLHADWRGDALMCQGRLYQLLSIRRPSFGLGCH